jgi:hypothetical protein
MNYTTLSGFETLTFDKCMGTLFTTCGLLYGYTVPVKAGVLKVSCVGPMASTISSQRIRGYTSVKATSKFTYFLKLNEYFIKNN